MTARENEATARTWVAIAYGALDVRESESFTEGTELLVVPTLPAEPMALQADGAGLWWRLLAGPLSETELTEDELEIVEQMEALGIASQDPDHPNRFTEVAPPWLSSPLHELVYALVQSVADAASIDLVFIKGPVLHKQGLREREHSGDVDLWVAPGRLDRLTCDLRPWGWRVQPGHWSLLPNFHSVTLESSASWACELDLHRRFPGVALDDDAAFSAVSSHTAAMGFAGVRSAVPTVDASAVLAALHLLRPSPGAETDSHDYEVAAELLRRGSPQSLHAARELAAFGGLSRSVTIAFPDEAIDTRFAPLSEDWLLYARPSKSLLYLRGLRLLSWRDRAQALRSILWPSSEYVMSNRVALGLPRVGLLRARLERILRAVRAVGSGGGEPNWTQQPNRR